VDERLDSWKEIAVYLQRDVRTVQRWASSRGLPVRRVPGGAKPRVFAVRSEIEGWLRAGVPELEA
jgi:phage terminase Nu1 subunit (DNA packaging protein)